MKPAPRFGHETARRAVDAIQAEITARGFAGIIAVTDAHGDLVAFLRMDGAALSSIDVAINKAYTAARLGTSTKAVGLQANDPATAFDVAYYGTNRIVGWAGGLPVRFGDEVVGAVAVSGLTEALDEEVAALGVALILAEMANETSERSASGG